MSFDPPKSVFGKQRRAENAAFRQFDGMPHVLRREDVVLDDQDVLTGESRKLTNIHERGDSLNSCTFPQK